MNNSPEQEQHKQGPEPVPVPDAARHFGITERAVRKRIAAGKLRGIMVDRAWHVYLSMPTPDPEPKQFRSAAGFRNQESSGPVPLTPLTAQVQMNSLMQEWIAPLTTRIEMLAGENGELRADLRNERDRREEAERERDDLRQRLEAPPSPERPADDESRATSDTTPHSAPQCEITALQPPRSWWRRLLDLG